MDGRQSEKYAAAVRIQMRCPLSHQIGQVNKPVTAGFYLLDRFIH